MKKNYFGKFFAIATVFAGLSLTSCNKNDNAIINGQVFEPSNYQLVDGGAVINANTPSEVSRMITRLRQDIIKAAENKETFTININAAALNATAGDNTLSFLTVTNGDLVVNFNGTITTDEPLVLQSKGVDEDQTPYTTAIGKVEFNFPAGTSNIDLDVNMPKTSVTIKPTSGSLGINELSTKTAKTTLNIESGVTVNWLHFKDIDSNGYVVIKNGGKINGVASQDLNLYPNGITFKGTIGKYDPETDTWVYTDFPYLVKDSVRTSTDYTDNDFYRVQNGKLLAKDDGYPSNLFIRGTDAKAADDATEIIIPDGVKAWIYTWQQVASPNWPTVNVTGEGDATIMRDGYRNSDDKICFIASANFTKINKLTNVTVDFSHALIYNSEDKKYEVLEVDTTTNDFKNYSSNIYLPKTSENCTFNAKTFNIGVQNEAWWGPEYILADDIVSSTHKNSTFNSLTNDDNNTFAVYFPAQNDKRKSFTLAFDNCEFNQAKFYSDFFRTSDWSYDYKDFKAYISFDNSKIGGKAITKSTNMIHGVNNDIDYSGSKPVILSETFYTIDGVNYKPIQQDNKWYLVEVE